MAMKTRMLDMEVMAIARNPSHNFGYGVVRNNTAYGKNPGSRKTLLFEKCYKIHRYPPGHRL